MFGDGEPAKILLPYVRRADEIQKYEPLIAYYCRRYAMERGLKIRLKERTKMVNEILSSLTIQLEKDKDSIQLGSEDYVYVERFALRLFLKADNQDRSCRVDLTTAKTFYAASLFFEVLHNFGDLPSHIEQKQRYAAWKAAVIGKALREKRKPSAETATGDDTLIGSSTSQLQSQLGSLAQRLDVEESTAEWVEGNVGQELTIQPKNNNLASRKGPAELMSPSALATSNVEQHEVFDDDDDDDDDDDEDPFYDCVEVLDDAVVLNTGSESDSDGGADRAGNRSSTPADVKDKRHRPGPAEVAEAHKAARLAVSALAFDDIPSAISFMKQALDLLTKSSGSP